MIKKILFILMLALQVTGFVATVNAEDPPECYPCDGK